MSLGFQQVKKIPRNIDYFATHTIRNDENHHLKGKNLA